MLAAALESDAVVIPFGGGSNISGSLEAPPDETRPVISVDMTRMDRVLSIDAEARLAEVQAGALGPELERQLNAQGWTLGHFPDSFAHSTLGGWIATRSSGMQSDKYGDIADLTRGLRVGHAVGHARRPARAEHLDRPERAGDDPGQRGPAGDRHQRHRARAPAAGGAGDPRLPAADLGGVARRDARDRRLGGAPVGDARVRPGGDAVLVRDQEEVGAARQAAEPRADGVPPAPQGLRPQEDVPRLHRLRGQRGARQGAAPRRRPDRLAPRRPVHRQRPGRALRPEEVRHAVHPRLPARPR